MSSIIKSPFINYACNNKKIIEVTTDSENAIEQASSVIKYNKDEIDAIIEKETSKAKVVANNIINKAMLESESILQDAQNKALEMKQEAYNEALEKGYIEGLEKGEEEIVLKKQEVQLMLEDAIKQKEDILRSIEPKISLIITSLVEKLTNYVVDKEPIILYLIQKGFSEVEVLEDVIVRVSVDDYDYVLENKSIFTSNVSEQVSIEILKDASLGNNDCIIETKSGNIDCSLDTQLSGLNSDLQLITDSMDLAK
ncbi:MAG: FliH/SctL family protein [Vallitalea sp.]|nr:FliH/SctL family protein [Vallitalea sp.]